jgi:hypothetical protein
MGQAVVKGRVLDGLTQEPLPGATVTYGPGLGMVTDYDGNYSLPLDPGNYTIVYSYVGYGQQAIDMTLKEGEVVNRIVRLGSLTLKEVSIVADIARDRQTPVAVSNISPRQIEEELGSQDLPMILNHTPGVYATQSGGGDGDARINIRGFDQTNIAVLIDGIPVNDMQNRRVFWSNWFGLDLATAGVQVQRGLSASKLVLPSIGGTINILTKGIDNKQSTKVRQEFGSGNFSRTSFMHNSGRGDNGWGYTLSGSYKKGDGLVDATWTEGLFYFLKIEKMTPRHRLSFTAFGAPQRHGQRTFKGEIGEYSHQYARDLGVSDSLLSNIPDRGRYYNQHWGQYEDYDFVGVANNPPPPPFPAEADEWVITRRGELNNVYERTNFYHKPQFTLRDFWQVHSNLSISNSAYLSIGRGGGTSLRSRSGIGETDAGLIDFQTFRDNQMRSSFNRDFDYLNVDPLYHPSDIRANNYIRTARNDHFWTGIISQANWKVSESLTLTAGIDARYFKGSQYSLISEFVGGDYLIDNSDENAPRDQVKREGDRLFRDQESFVTWGGAFLQGEYTHNKWNITANLTAARTGFRARDYYRPRTITVDGQQIEVGFRDTVSVGGQVYTRESDGLQTYQSDWIWVNGFTAKTGANYDISDRLNVFVNGGYMSIAPIYGNVIDLNADPFSEFFNENISAVEVGAQYGAKAFTINLNAYYTYWGNRPVSRLVPVSYPVNGANGDVGEDTFAFVRSIDALHRGVEFEAAYQITPKWQVEGLLSVGNWTWESEEQAQYVQGNVVIADADGEPLFFTIDPKGVKVGDAAQTQIGASLEFKPDRNSFIRARMIHFTDNYSQFQPESVTGVNEGRQSWRIPKYTLFELHASYRMRLEKGNIRVGASVFNLFDVFYISDAQNNDTFTRFTNTQNFDAASAGVFPGLGRRFNVNITFEI